MSRLMRSRKLAGRPIRRTFISKQFQALFVVVFLFEHCLTCVSDDADFQAFNLKGLRSFCPEGVKVGAFADAWAINGYRSSPRDSNLEEQFRNLVVREYQIMTVPWFPFDFHVAPGRYSFTVNGEPLLDKSVDFLMRNGISWHCLPLVGPNPIGMQCGYEPKWLADSASKLSPAQLEETLKDRISYFLERYGAKLHSIGVVNESLSDFSLGQAKSSSDTYRDSFWNRMGLIEDPAGNLHPSYVVKAFEFARGQCPSLKLVYNENQVETKSIHTKNSFGTGHKKYSNEKQVRLIRLAKFLKSRGILDAIGLQLHLSINENGELHHFASNHYFEVSSISECIAEIRSVGLEVYVTELDIGIPSGTPDMLQKQSRAYRDVVSAAIEGGANIIITWGIIDEDRPNHWRNGELALPFTSSFAPKPAYDGIKEGLRGRQRPVP